MMSAFCRINLSRIASSLTKRQPKNVFGSRVLENFNLNRRYLYNESFLRMDKFDDVRNNVGSQFGHMREKFFDRIVEHLNGKDEQKMVFTEDLKNIIYLVGEKPEEMDILRKMIEKFNCQKKDIQFSEFVFGPVVMRLFHHMNKPDLALEMLYDKNCDGFFDQLSSTIIIMDLLYKNERFEDVLKVYEYLVNKSLFDPKYPTHPLVYVLASCYKLDTADAFNFALNLMQNAKRNGAYILRRATNFFALLALANNQPDIALECIATIKPNSVVRNLKIMSLAQMGRFDEAIISLRSLTERNDLYSGRAQVFHDTMECLDNELKNKDNKDAMLDFERIRKSIDNSDVISKQSLVHYLCQAPQRDPTLQQDRNENNRDPNENNPDRNENYRGRNENYRGRNENNRDPNENNPDRNENYRGRNENYRGSNENYRGSNENYRGRNENYRGSNENYRGRNENYRDRNENYDQDSNLQRRERLPRRGSTRIRERNDK